MRRIHSPNEISPAVGLIKMLRRDNHLDKVEAFYHYEDEVEDIIEDLNGEQSLSVVFCLYQSVSIDLSRLDTRNVINTSYMLWDSPNLETVDLSGWDLSKVALSKSMFEGCNSLKTIIMRGCNDDTVNLIKSQVAADGLDGIEFITT